MTGIHDALGVHGLQSSGSACLEDDTEDLLTDLTQALDTTARG